MSFIWNVLFAFSSEELWRDGEEEARSRCEALDAINSWMPDDGKLVDVTTPTFRSGSGMTAHLYGGGFKHFDLKKFIRIVAAQVWQDPLNVQLFLKSDADEKFTMHPVFKPKRQRLKER